MAGAIEYRSPRQQIEQIRADYLARAAITSMVSVFASGMVGPHDRDAGVAQSVDEPLIA